MINPMGLLTIDGSVASWTTSGRYGISVEGTLNITNGGRVNVSGVAQVSFYHPNSRTTNFGANGGALTTAALYAAPTQLTGTGTINTQQLIGDGDWLFDPTHGRSQMIK